MLKSHPVSLRKLAHPISHLHVNVSINSVIESVELHFLLSSLMKLSIGGASHSMFACVPVCMQVCVVAWCGPMAADATVLLCFAYCPCPFI